jgi:mannose-6-phosphate isomerase-like protein (cupin superfamily)
MTTSPTTPGNQDAVSVCLAGQGPITWAMGSLFERLVAADTTGGSLGAAIVTQPPGLATPTHIHTREAEAWFVLDGSLTYKAGPELVDLAGGDFIYLPANVPHAYRVTGKTPARYLALTFPGALLDLYDEVGRPATKRQLPDGGIPPEDIQRWNELAPRFGLRIVGPPLPDLDDPGSHGRADERHHQG